MHLVAGFKLSPELEEALQCMEIPDLSRGVEGCIVVLVRKVHPTPSLRQQADARCVVLRRRDVRVRVRASVDWGSSQRNFD